jgi:uncharacterized protein YukE
MSIFNIVIEDVSDESTALRTMTDELHDLSNRLRSVLDPITDGAWTGEGSDAFSEDMRTLIRRTNLFAQDLAAFGSALNVTSSEWASTIQALDNLVQS